jgi:hypothetical protein
MNKLLQKLFTNFYNIHTVPVDKDRGASSIAYTQRLRDCMQKMFKSHNIRSMFDAGCNDCTWASRLDNSIEYHGGDISLSMISQAWFKHPELDVIVHDATTDAFPLVDVLFVRDVTIHLCQRDKWLLLDNWVRSGIPWILITQDSDVNENKDVAYDNEINQFPVAVVNWHLDPWKFPEPTDRIYEMPDSSGKTMSLWHVDQLRDIVNGMR